MIQSIVNIVFPTKPSYKVAYRSRLYEMAYERGTDLRARFASHAIKIVKRFGFFDQSEYKNNPDAVIRYVRWAIREDGPMLFRVPVPEFPPEEGTSNSKALDPFQSPFIIELITPIIKCLRGSVGHHMFGEPKAAFALAAAGLERAFLCFESGKFVKPTQTFGSEAVGDTVKEYMESLNNFTERRWKQVKAACGVEGEMKRTPPPGSLSLNGKRRTIYIASSPPPETVDYFEN
ncbi:hypothetical protein FPV67DRAFT_1469062 [Lyophyllum atratum]|nr:hypothetical protein FPV67DRAFT_1469062 [Lyophyllum atratum]